MIKTASSICLLGTLFILTGCATTTADMRVIGISNVPTNYTFAPGFNPPQVMYTDPVLDSDNIPNGVNIDERLAPAATVQELQQRLLIKQDENFIIMQDPSIF